MNKIFVDELSFFVIMYLYNIFIYVKNLSQAHINTV